MATTPLAEASIYFGLMGPLFYLTHSPYPFEEALLSATSILDDNEADQMVVGTSENPALFLVLGHQTAGSLMPADKMDFRQPLPLVLRQLQTFQTS